MGKNNILVVFSNPTNQEQRLALRTVKNTLSLHKAGYKLIKRDKLKKNNFKNKTLIIAVGGDGTFLMAAQFIFDKTPILGVNSDPKCKEGFFMSAAKKDFEEKFKKILNGSYKLIRLQRLEAFIDNKRVPELALNEFYIASEKQHHTARYFLALRGRRERQKSSGILISTAAGSNAWIKSAGGKVLPLLSEKFEYLVREPYCGKVSAKCNMINGILNKNEKIEMVFEFGSGVLIADSLSREHKFKAGQKVAAGLSEKPLHTIYFS